MAEQQRTIPATVTEALLNATRCIEWAQEKEPGSTATHLLACADSWMGLAATVHNISVTDD